MLTVTLYTRPNCHLCEQAKTDLQSIQAQAPHTLVEINIETDPYLLEKYQTDIPVIEVGPYRKSAPFTHVDLLVTLRAASDRQSHLNQVGDETYQRRVQNGQAISSADRFSLWLSRNYLWMVNLLVLLYIGLPFLAPVLMKSGAELPARLIYTAYSPLCHELAFRSFFLFGEQPYYPREVAGIPGLKTYGQVTHLDENDLLAARAFLGNDEMGYKVAICQRDVAIYLAIFAFGVLFAITGRRIKPLHWLIWFFIAVIPVGLDGFSQLLSQVSLPGYGSLIPFRESTPLLRVITGALFGFGTAWLGLPYMEESMRETREMMVKKFAIVQKR